MDPIFEEEQQHLSDTYTKLQDIETRTKANVEARLADAISDKEDMLDELFLDFGNGVNLETYVEYEAMHKIIDEYNLANDIDAEVLGKVQVLKRRPYFAKVRLQFKPGAEPRDIYIGTTGMTDDSRRHFIVDWRSPVAEVYYNQSNGATSYEANGRTINVNLQLRRQFDITRDKLNAYFDTTVAIEDPLLLASLAKGRTAKLTDITSTIQKEQNLVVRHADVPALLVNGIAGSGKTSVLLQRIAYLFYQQRKSLDPRNVVLVSPNPVFAKYIDEVLPSMGERNPQTVTWNSMMERLGLGGRSLGDENTAESLRRIDQLLPTLELTAKDFQDIKVGSERVVPANQAHSVYAKLKRLPAGIHRAVLTVEELTDRLDKRIDRMMRSEDVHDEMMDLPEEEQIRIFGHHLVLMEEEEQRDCARLYLEDRYASVREALENGDWLRIDRIGMRLLGKESLSAAEWLYLKLALAGGGDRFAKYVMVDEVQDYTEAQLMVLARYFYNAHFLMLGDENQAIHPGTATFSQVERVFMDAFGSVDRCELMTSYRSSPEITALFTTLMDPDERVRTSSVQRPGRMPTIKTCENEDVWADALRSAVSAAAREKLGLTAIVCNSRRSLKQAADALDIADRDDVLMLDGKKPLPSHGILLLDIALAKGLEFDRVILADASTSAFGTSDLDRHRLYTAISRATQQVTILSNGPLTALLQN